MEDKHIPVTLLCTHYNIEVSFITSLTEYGLLEIITLEDTQYVDKDKIRELEKLIQLHYDLDINMEGIDAISHLLQRINTLQKELNAAKSKLGLYDHD